MAANEKGFPAVVPSFSTRTLHHPSFLALFRESMLSATGPQCPPVPVMTPMDFHYTDPSLPPGCRIPNIVTQFEGVQHFQLNTPSPIMSAWPGQSIQPDPFLAGSYPTRDLGSTRWAVTGHSSPTTPKRKGPPRRGLEVIQLSAEEDEAITNLMKLHHQTQQNLGSRNKTEGCEELAFMLHSDMVQDTPVIDQKGSHGWSAIMDQDFRSPVCKPHKSPLITCFVTEQTDGDNQKSAISTKADKNHYPTLDDIVPAEEKETQDCQRSESHGEACQTFTTRSTPFSAIALANQHHTIQEDALSFEVEECNDQFPHLPLLCPSLLHMQCEGSTNGHDVSDQRRYQRDGTLIINRDPVCVSPAVDDTTIYPTPQSQNLWASSEVSSAGFTVQNQAHPDHSTVTILDHQQRRSPTLVTEMEAARVLLTLMESGSLGSSVGEGS